MSRNNVRQGKGMERFSVCLKPIAREIHALKQKALTGLHLLGYTLLLSHVSFVPYAYGSPTGGTVVGGTGTITQSGVVTDIVQQSASMAIDWSSYNLNSDEVVNYIQPDSNSLSLNRILSNNPSQINGQINANGQVILVNPNGLFFGEGASVNVGGLIASGLDISPDDFMNGNYVFNEVLGTSGTVINTGLINAATGGNVTLLGKQVHNQGVISANLGAVNMAAGKQAVLTFDNQGLIGISVTKDILQNELGVDPAVLNSGEINASGGRILLTASQSQDIFSRAVNTGDLTQATSVVVNEDGSFDLTGGADVVNSGTLSTATTEANTDGGNIALLGQNITSSGTITADAQQGKGGNIELHSVDTTLLTQNSVTTARAETEGQGGIVKILGDKVGLFDQSQIDVSGANGGGQALIGGDYQGQNSLIRNASRTYISTNAQIKADALIDGDGGRIINWGNDYTWFYGTASATGGANSGNGGFVEISGKYGLSFDGNVDTTAANGELGTLLFDPVDIQICNASSCTEDSPTGTPPDYLFSATSGLGPFRINETTLENLSASAKITLKANNNVTIDNLSDNVLGLQIDNASGGSLTIKADADGDNVGSFSMDAGDTIRTQGGSVSISGASVSVGSIDTQGTSPAGGASGNGTNGGAISLTSSAGNITVNGTLNSGGGAALDGAATNNDYVGGNAGAITLNSGTNNIILNNNISAVGGAGIVGGVADSSMDGAGGNINVTATNVQLAGVSTFAIEAGKAASVTINSDIDYTYIGSGAGSLTVNAGDSVAINSVMDSIAGNDTLDLALHANTDGNSTGAVTANGAITTQGGTVTMDGMSISTQTINTTGDSGMDGGAVSLTSTATTGVGISVTGNITTTGGSPSGTGEMGGNVTLVSAGGTIETRSINTAGSNGQNSNYSGGKAGTIGIYNNINNGGAITITGDLTANGGTRAGTGDDGAGGDITIAGVTLDGNGVPSQSLSNAAGAVALTGVGLGNVTAYGADVSITAASVTAAGNITTTGQYGQAGGGVALKATANTGTGISVGTITTTGGNASAVGENGGNVLLASAGGSIATGSVNSSGSVGEGSSDAGGTAGTIGIYNSNSGAVTVTGNLDANGDAGTGSGDVGAGNNITIAGVNVDANGIPVLPASGSAGAVLVTGGGNGNVTAHGANVTINAASIAANAINTSGALNQNGGAVELTAPGGISVTSVTTNAGNRSSNGTSYQAGDVTLDTTAAGTGDITVSGNISALGGYFDDTGNDFGNGGAGGNVALNSESGAIAVTGTINTSGNSANGSNNDGGAAGDIDISSASGTIAVSSLISTGGGGGEGSGGTGGAAGHIDLNTGSSTTNAVTITGAVTADGGDSANGTAGSADYISLHSDSGTMALQGNVSATGTNAADVTVSADSLQLSTTAAQNISGDTVTLTSTNSANAIQLQQSLSVNATSNAIINGNINYGGGASGALNIAANYDISLDAINSGLRAFDVMLAADNDSDFSGDVLVNGYMHLSGGDLIASGVNYDAFGNSVDTLGGQVRIDAATIALGNVYTNGITSSGNVSLISDTTTYSPSSAGGVSVGGIQAGRYIFDDGDAGNVTVSALGAGDVSIDGYVNANGGIFLGSGGDITVDAANGSVSVIGNMYASGADGAGDISMTADTVRLIGASAQSISGNAITITSNTNPTELQHSLYVNAATDTTLNGDVNYTGSAGTLNVAAGGNISVDGIVSSGNALDITMTATQDTLATGGITVGGDIDTAGGNYQVNALSYLGSTNAIATQGGQVTIDAGTISAGDISTVNIGSSGGLVRLTTDTSAYLTALTGDITVGTILTSGDVGTAGGNITVETLTVGSIDVAGSLVSAAGGTGGTAGAIIVNSVNGNISVAGDVNANGNVVSANTGNANTVNLQAINGAIDLQGDVSATGAASANISVNAQAVRLIGTAAQSISGNNVDIVSSTTPIELQHSLSVNAASTAAISGGIDYTRAAAGTLDVAANNDIMLDAITASGGALNINLAADSDSNATGSTNINGNVATLGGNYTVSGVNYDESAYTVDTAGGDATITASGNVLLGVMDSGAGNLTVVAGGANGITQATGTNLTVTGTSDFTSAGSGADIVLANSSNDLQGTINLSNQGGVGADTTLTNVAATTIGNANLSGDLTLQSGGNLAIGNVALTDGDVIATVNGNVTSTTASGTNISANSITLDATSNIGQVGTALTTSTSMLDVRTTSGQIDMTNTGNVLVNMMHTDSGDITFNNTGRMVIDRIETDIVSSTISLNNDDGDILGIGNTPNETYADADIAGYSVDIYVNRGNLGEAGRPLVIYAPGASTAFSTISFDPVFLPKTGRDGPFVDSSLVSFSASDTLAALSGEQVRDVEDLDDVDPAIFTEVHNYNLAEISIKLPRDQRYENELEQ